MAIFQIESPFPFRIICDLHRNERVSFDEPLVINPGMNRSCIGVEILFEPLAALEDLYSEKGSKSQGNLRKRIL
jgi:hypothetical protein